jgi:hypothetical protein
MQVIMQMDEDDVDARRLAFAVDQATFSSSVSAPYTLFDSDHQVVPSLSLLSLSLLQWPLSQRNALSVRCENCQWALPFSHKTAVASHASPI